MILNKVKKQYCRKKICYLSYEKDIQWKLLFKIITNSTLHVNQQLYLIFSFIICLDFLKTFYFTYNTYSLHSVKWRSLFCWNIKYSKDMSQFDFLKMTNRSYEIKSSSKNNSKNERMLNVIGKIFFHGMISQGMRKMNRKLLFFLLMRYWSSMILTKEKMQYWTFKIRYWVYKVFIKNCYFKNSCNLNWHWN